MNRTFLFLSLCLLSLAMYGQEGVSGLLYYPDIKKENKGADRESLKNFNQEDTLELPFFDDFAQEGNRPNPARWLDEYVYINNTLAVNPPSIGVATFDAIDENGVIYTNSDPSFFADTLTSLPINLAYASSDNVVLSFFYQQEGLGNPPEAGDSLVLEFSERVDSVLIWDRVWSMAGDTLHDFRYVSIPITDSRFLKNGFLFRFMNKVSFPKPQGEPEKLANADHWHIDFVYLDTARTHPDSSFDDVAVTRPIQGILNFFSSIPIKHFPAAYNSEKASKLAFSYQNLNLREVNSVERILLIHHEDFDKIDTLGKDNIDPAASKTVNFRIRDIPLVDNPPDYVVLDLTAYLTPDSAVERGAMFRWNDTVKYNQVLHNYYAYDDGSPEAGYYASGSGTNTDNSIACKYDIYQVDTLRAVKIYFIPTRYDTTENLEFLIKVWSVEENLPGDTLYCDNNTTRIIGKTGQFNLYQLERPIVLPLNFFVGITQLEDKRYNIGLDRNTNHQDKMFYFLNNQWTQSTIPEARGSLMIHPIMGDENTLGVSSSRIVPLLCSAYPNPANEYIRIDVGNMNFDRTYAVTIYDITGKTVYSSFLTESEIDVSAFPEGLYVVKIMAGNGALATKKILVSH